MEIYFFSKRTKRFYERLQKPCLLRAQGAFEILEEKSYALGLPLSRALGGGLFELRVIDSTHIRFVYVFHKGNIWVLHGFVKKTDKISNHDIEFARKEFRKLLRHYNK